MSDKREEFEKLLKEGKHSFNFEQGSIVQGQIVFTEKDGAYVDIGAKSEAYLPLKEITNMPRRTKVEDVVKVGEDHKLYVLKESTEENPVILSLKRVNLAEGWAKLEESKKINESITGVVISIVKGGVILDLFGIKGFIPSSQLRLKSPPSDKLIDTSLTVKILEVDPRKNKLILSQKMAVQEEKAGLREKTLQNLEIGQTVEGEVVRVTDFGAFVDLGGIDGLLPISEFSWKRVTNPQELLSVGEKIKLKVLKIDRETNRISLSLKRMQNDPWNELENTIKENETIKGAVSKIASFGAFIEICPGVEGLLPRSEITSETENPKIEDYLSVGKEIEALVKRFAPTEHRLSLSLKDLEDSKGSGDASTEEDEEKEIQPAEG